MLNELLEGWVDVNSGLLPDDGVSVYVWPHEDVASYILSFEYKGKVYPTGWYREDGTKPLSGVTHWHKLPDGPSNYK